jgi:hypothetical protein
MLHASGFSADSGEDNGAVWPAKPVYHKRRPNWMNRVKKK